MLGHVLRLLVFVAITVALGRAPAGATAPTFAPLRTDLLQAAEQPIEDLPNRLFISSDDLAARLTPEAVGVTLAGEGITDIALAHVARCKKLVDLQITGTNMLTDRGLALLSGLPLRRLQLGYSPRFPLRHPEFTDAGMKHIAGIQTLEYLYVSGATKITDETVKRFASLPKLRELALTLAESITSAGLEPLAATRLERLEISACKSLDDDALKHLSRLKTLGNLGIRQVPLTDTGVAHLEGHPALKRLDISFCGDPGDAALASCAKIPTLEDLVLNKLENVSDSGIKTVAALPALRKLAIGAMPKLTEAALAPLAQCKTLRTLHVQSQTGMSAAWLAPLKSCTWLTGIDLRGCKGVVENDALALRKAIAGCQVILLDDWDPDRLRTGYEYPRAFAVRPIVKLDEKERRQVCRDAVNGDPFAIERVRSSGLTYLRDLLGAIEQGAPAVGLWAHSLLHAWRDWYEDFVDWELLLAGHDAHGLAEHFRLNRQRWETPDALGAAVLLRAWRLGDTETQAVVRKELAEWYPDSAWINAACAVCGELEPEPAVAAMLALMPTAIDLRVMPVKVSPSCMAELPRQYGTGPMNRADVNAAGDGRAGVQELFPYARDLRMGSLVQALGVALGRLPADKSAAGKLRFGEIVKASGHSDPGILEDMLAAAMGNEAALPRALETTEFLEPGRTLAVHAASKALHDQPIERWSSAILAYLGTPEDAYCRRVLLDTFVDGPDPHLARVAIRAVAGLGGDMPQAWADVARALVAHGGMASQLDGMRAALKGSEAELAAISNAIGAGDVAALEKLAGAAVAKPVSPEIQQGLLDVFVSGLERQARGDRKSLWLANRAAFLRAAGRTTAAIETWLDAVTHEKAANRANLALMNDTMYGCMRVGDVDAIFARQKGPRAEAVGKFKTYAANFTKDSAERDFFLGQRKKQDEDGEYRLDAATIKRIETKSVGAMGGYAMLALAVDAMRGGDWPQYRKYADSMFLDDVLNPYCARMYAPSMSITGRFIGFQNWHVTIRSALHGMMLAPFSFHSLASLESLLARSGDCGYSQRALCAGLWGRPVDSAFVQSGLLIVGWLPVSSQALAGHLRRWLVVNGRDLGADTMKRALQTLFNLTFHDLDIERREVVGNLSVRPYLMRTVQQLAQGTWWNSNLNGLLNSSYLCWRQCPEQAEGWAERARAQGISAFGEFVAAQGRIAAMAMQGKSKDALALYAKLRGGRTGNPPVLDRFLLAGALAGNQHAILPELLAVIEKRNDIEDGTSTLFALRRANMAAGRYERVTEIDIPTRETRGWGAFADDSSRLFHECRHLLDKEMFTDLAVRASAFDAQSDLTSVGEFTDAMLLRALALKELESDEALTPDRTLHSRIFPTQCVLDCQVLEVLAGTRKWRELGKPSNRAYWMGSVVSERNGAPNGSGFLTAAEGAARDNFIRGLLAWLAGEKDESRKLLQACVKADQRCAHEWHVAQWLLENRLN